MDAKRDLTLYPYSKGFVQVENLVGGRVYTFSVNGEVLGVQMHTFPQTFSKVRSSAIEVAEIYG